MVLELEFLHYSMQLYNWGDGYLTTLEVCKMFGQKFGQTKQSVVPYLNGPIMSVSGLYFPIEDGHINDLGAEAVKDNANVLDGQVLRLLQG